MTQKSWHHQRRHFEKNLYGNRFKLTSSTNHSITPLSVELRNCLLWLLDNPQIYDVISAAILKKKDFFFIAFDVNWHPLKIIPLHRRALRPPSMTFWEPGSWWRHQRRHFWKKRKFLICFQSNSTDSTNHSITPTSSGSSFYDFLRTRKLMTSSASPFFKKKKISHLLSK